jgi:hypothetical protein
MNTYRWSRFSPYGRGFLALGQAPALSPDQGSAWTARAQAAIAQYDALMKRTALIQDTTSRYAILAWIGTPNTPTAPAFQYQSVKDNLASGGPWDSTHTTQVTNLEAVNTQFNTRVSAGEQAGTYGPWGPLSIVDASGQITDVGIGIVAMSALTLFVIPVFVLKE